jgi:hypothetical protein
MDTIAAPDMAEKHQHWFPSAKRAGEKCLFYMHLIVATHMLFSTT